MTASSVTKQEAAYRIRKSMAHIEMAQRHIDEAACSLSSIQGPGMADEWGRLCKLYDRVKSHWYRVQDKLLCGRFDLDSDADASFMARPQTTTKEG